MKKKEIVKKAREIRKNWKGISLPQSVRLAKLIAKKETKAVFEYLNSLGYQHESIYELYCECGGIEKIYQFSNSKGNKFKIFDGCTGIILYSQEELKEIEEIESIL